ncbi:putative ATP-dependent DEAD/H RNA helicase, partial [Trypanosoma cruzi]
MLFEGGGTRWWDGSLAFCLILSRAIHLISSLTCVSFVFCCFSFSCDKGGLADNRNGLRYAGNACIEGMSDTDGPREPSESVAFVVELEQDMGRTEIEIVEKEERKNIMCRYKDAVSLL